MAIFSYRPQPLTATIIEGVIEASDEKIAIEQTQNTGVIPFKVSAPKEGLKRTFAFKSAKVIS